MLVIVVENVEPQLRGRLAVWLVEARAGVYVGNYGKRVREMMWGLVEDGVGEGSAVMAWKAPTEAGYDLRTLGENRRVPIDFNGLKLVRFLPEQGEEATDEASDGFAE